MAPTQVAPGVWAAGTRYVNYYVVDGGADGLTLVDAVCPGTHAGSGRRSPRSTAPPPTCGRSY